MTWFKVDDKAHETHRRVSLAADGLWVRAGAWSGDLRTDGFVPEDIAARWASRAQARKLAAELVAEGLWEPAVDGSEPGWRFVDWGRDQPTRDDTSTDIGRVRWRRKNALSKDRALCEQVVERDKGRCRYCGVRVNWSDRRGKAGGTYDHVDPDGPNSLENVVVACRRCNGRKKDRTPDEAGMTLLPVPTAWESTPEPDPEPEIIDSDLAPLRETVRESGRVGSGAGSGCQVEPGRVPAVGGVVGE